jgi:hypothetical protein
MNHSMTLSLENKTLTGFPQFLGQQNITNAYVSGMKEDLNAQGNELNYFVVACKLISPSNQHALNLTV